MKPHEFLEYLWARPQTNALAQALATVYVERGRFDLVPLPAKGLRTAARRDVVRS